MSTHRKQNGVMAASTSTGTPSSLTTGSPRWLGKRKVEIMHFGPSPYRRRRCGLGARCRVMFTGDIVGILRLLLRRRPEERLLAANTGNAGAKHRVAFFAGEPAPQGQQCGWDFVFPDKSASNN